MKKNLTLLITLSLNMSFSQKSSNELPYYEIPEASKTFTAGTVAARLVDGLGFRYYWASEGLTKTDLNYKIADDSRSADETIQHIYGLSKTIVNATLKKPNFNEKEADMTFEDMRKQTLINFKTAADILRTSDDISQYKIIFGDRKIPFWNAINGPIEDAVWHCGQLASFRRASGNPINPNVSHFSGTIKK